MKQNYISNSLNTIAQIHCSNIKVCVKYMISVIYAYWRHMEADIWFNPGWDEGFNPFSDPMINFSSKGVVDIHLRSFPWEVFQNLIHNMCSEMIIFEIAYRNNNNLYECNCTRLNCEHLMSITLLLVNNSHGMANCRKTTAICHCNQESLICCPFVIIEYAPNSFTVQCWHSNTKCKYIFVHTTKRY